MSSNETAKASPTFAQTAGVYLIDPEQPELVATDDLLPNLPCRDKRAQSEASCSCRAHSKQRIHAYLHLDI